MDNKLNIFISLEHSILICIWNEFLGGLDKWENPVEIKLKG